VTIILRISVFQGLYLRNVGCCKKAYLSYAATKHELAAAVEYSENSDSNEEQINLQILSLTFVETYLEGAMDNLHVSRLISVSNNVR
jgi:hypothetical protein